MGRVSETSSLAQAEEEPIRMREEVFIGLVETLASSLGLRGSGFAASRFDELDGTCGEGAPRVGR